MFDTYTYRIAFYPMLFARRIYDNKRDTYVDGTKYGLLLNRTKSYCIANYGNSAYIASFKVFVAY